jgi:hypothetical protein
MYVEFGYVYAVCQGGDYHPYTRRAKPLRWLLPITLDRSLPTGLPIRTTSYYFKADGKSRGKLGITPKRAMPVIGSYDAENNVLTIAKFDIDNNRQCYLNQEWRTDREPLSGDAVNAYNDGPLADGSQMGPFYEIESVSPAAFLKPGGKLKHAHKVFHFTGDKAELNTIAQKVLGVTLAEVEAVFK